MDEAARAGPGQARAGRKIHVLTGPARQASVHFRADALHQSEKDVVRDFRPRVGRAGGHARLPGARAHAHLAFGGVR